MIAILRWGLHAGIIILLTASTQVGGVAWLVSRVFRRKLVAFTGLYGVLWVAAVMLAPFFGREALPCRGEPLRMQGVGYCVALRHFVTPEMGAVARDVAQQVGGVTLALDAGFPFFDGFPLLPHLSHDDGEKLDFALVYAVPGRTRSPVGYWAFETLDDETCAPEPLTLRWSFRWLQPYFPVLPLDRGRTRALVEALLEDDRISKVLLEPALSTRLGLAHPKLRFQGCRAARHDDHIHVQI